MGESKLRLHQIEDTRKFSAHRAEEWNNVDDECECVEIVGGMKWLSDKAISGESL